jgi:hypothetical protein
VIKSPRRRARQRDKGGRDEDASERELTLGEHFGHSSWMCDD